MKRVLLINCFVLCSVVCFGESVSFENSTFSDIVAQKCQGPLTTESLAGIESLCIDSVEDVNLESIGHLPNLISLKVYNSGINNLQKISVLKNLKDLTVINCDIQDISIISQLENLINLNLSYNQISDISPLSGSQKLKYLNIGNNDVNNLSPLNNLISLEKLDVRDNPLGQDEIIETTQILKGQNLSFNCISESKDQVIKEPYLYAKGKFSYFTDTAKPRMFHELARPLLPLVPQDIVEAGKMLQQQGDKDYFSEVGLILMRYSNLIHQEYRPASFVDANDPTVKAFFEIFELNPNNSDELYYTYFIADWISKNREKFGPSVLLDLEVEKHNRIMQEQLDENRKLLEEIERRRSLDKSDKYGKIARRMNRTSDYDLQIGVLATDNMGKDCHMVVSPEKLQIRKFEFIKAPIQP